MKLVEDKGIKTKRFAGLGNQIEYAMKEVMVKIRHKS